MKAKFKEGDIVLVKFRCKDKQARARVVKQLVNGMYGTVLIDPVDVLGVNYRAGSIGTFHENWLELITSAGTRVEGKPISPEDVRRGDTIRVTAKVDDVLVAREGRVDKIDSWGENRFFTTESKYVLNPSTHLVTEIILVEAFEEFPESVGSVIRIDYASDHFAYHTKVDGDNWVTVNNKGELAVEPTSAIRGTAERRGFKVVR